MALRPLPSDGSLGDGRLCWWSRPCAGATRPGDALFVEEEGESLWLLLVDVTGNGEAAAEAADLMYHAFLAQLECRLFSPADLLRHLHSELASFWAARSSSNAPDWYVEAVALYIDLSHRQVTGSLAGGPYPWVRVADGSWRCWKCPGGSWLGVPDLDTYTQETKELGRGEMLLAFSDGVAEVKKDNVIFLKGTLQELLAALTGPISPAEVLAALEEELGGFVGSGWPESDATALCWA